MPVRLIATDVDGTLINPQGIIPPENIRAIREAQRRGIVVAIASGRFPENIYVMLEEWGLRCPVIGINGGKTVDEGLTVLGRHWMEAEAAAAVQRALEEAGAEYFVFGEGKICTSRTDAPHHSELLYGDRLRQLGLVYAHGPEAARQCARERVYKFFVCNNVPLPPLREALAKIDGISLTQSSARNIEVMPRGVDKGRGIREFAARLGVPLEQVMALGDEENDIPMLSIVGWGVAMGNASEKTAHAAAFQTDSNDRCGFAKAVERYALNPEE